jgi:ribonuclease HI
MKDPFILYCDGASRGNPGPASIGAVLYAPSDREPVAEISEAIGVTTNNVAEYRALEAGLQRASELGVRRLRVRLDSQLLVKQLSGEYRVKSAGLKPLYASVCRLIEGFDAVEVSHVRRESNTVADALANEALDR